MGNETSNAPHADAADEGLVGGGRLTMADLLAAKDVLERANEPAPCSLCGEWGFHPIFSDQLVNAGGGDEQVRQRFGQFHRASQVNRLLAERRALRGAEQREG